LPPKINLKEMQIIQSIKDRGGVIMAIVIAIALISFILMDSKSGDNRPTSSEIGKINGNTIELSEFNNRVKFEEAKKSQNGQPLSGNDALQVREQVWNQVVAENVFYKEAEKLGIVLSPAELSSILKSDDQSNPLKQERDLLNEQGNFDNEKLQQRLNDIKKAKGEQREFVDATYFEPLKLSTAANKYNSMIGAASYYATWMQEQDAEEEKNFATISYVAVPYGEISDSAVVVKDEDINAYVASNKDLFKQEAGRTISYVSFSRNPSAMDSANARKQVEDLKSGLATDSSAKNFVARNSSSIEFIDDYLPLSRIQSTVKDSMVKYGVGTVSGPFVDGGNYSIAKVLGTTSLPDSVKARHILIATTDRQTGKALMTDSAAKKLADSILIAVNTGANFGALAAKYSVDGSKDAGGDLGTFVFGQMVPEFNKFCFNEGKAGSKKVVKTQFGYHVIDIQNQTNFKPAYKIAILAKPIVPSDETINAATLAATKAAANKSSKELADYATKNGLQVIEVPTTIKENDFAIGQMQDARNLVKWAFDAKLGAVSDPITVGKDFIVASVSNIYKEGTQNATMARAGAEAEVRNKKKAEIIVAKLAGATTLEAAAALYNKQVAVAGADSSIVMGAGIINGIGNEPKIIGAAFNKDYLTKQSAPIVGKTGVYVVKVNAITAKAAKTAEELVAQASMKRNALKGRGANWFEALRKQADVTDNRSKYF
jgi:peptidyl-prolyl cis-trans isomerase D